MLEKLKGFRTYATLIVIAVLGALVDIQTSCSQNPAELGQLCNFVVNPWFGKSIVVLSGIAAWFRKLAGTGK